MIVAKFTVLCLAWLVGCNLGGWLDYRTAKRAGRRGSK